MSKKTMILMIVICMAIVPMQIFGATDNHIPYITTSKEDEVVVGEIVIDNTKYDLRQGDYFSIRLIGAEFDFRDDDTPKVYGTGMEFRRTDDSSVYGYVDEMSQGEIITIRFFSKITGSEAKIVIDGQDSGMGSGTYVFATTSKTGEAYKGIIENREAALLNEPIVLNPIIVKEPHTAAFRSLLKDSPKDDTLIKLQLKNKNFELLEARADKPITFVVDDGEDSTYYELGQDPEVKFDYSTKTITFIQQNEDIFKVGGENYSIELINVRLSPVGSNIEDQKVDMDVSGLLVEDKTITIGQKVSAPLMLETSEEEISPGQEHKIKFSLQEAIPGTLFSKGYIELGVRGGAVIGKGNNFTLNVKEGNKAYNEKDFEFSMDPQGDQVKIEGLKRSDSKDLLRIEGEFTVIAPDRVTEEVYMFINEPAISGVVKETILTASEEIIQPPAPMAPKVQFTINQDAYKVDGVSHPIDANPYISVHNRIMVPFRYVAYALGVDVEDLKWDGPSQTITLKGDKPMTINITTGQMIVDGETSILSETRLMGGRTFVPVGEIGRAFGVEVDWDAESRTATFN